MPRLSNWPEKLDDFINSAWDWTFSRGVHDCCTFCLQAIEAIYGFKPNIPEYRSSGQAKSIISGSLFEYINSILGEPSQDFPSRGDIVGFTGIGEEDVDPDTIGVCLGFRSVVMGIHGVTFVDSDTADRYWSIDKWAQAL